MQFLNLLSKIERDDRYTQYGIFALRIVLAAFWAVHLIFKAFVVGMEATMAAFPKMGFPAWFAWGDVALEAVAIVALVLGLHTRLFSALLLVILLPAINVWLPKGFWFTQAGYEFPLFWALIQIVLVIIGPGAFSLRSLRIFDEKR